MKPDPTTLSSPAALPHSLLRFNKPYGVLSQFTPEGRWRGLKDFIDVAGVYAAGRLDATVVTRHRAILTGLGLPTTYDGSRWPELLAAMRVDKKARGSVLRFVVLDAIAVPGRLEGPDDDLLETAFRKVAS